MFFSALVKTSRLPLRKTLPALGEPHSNSSHIERCDRFSLSFPSTQISFPIGHFYDFLCSCSEYFFTVWLLKTFWNFSCQVGYHLPISPENLKAFRFSVPQVIIKHLQPQSRKIGFSLTYIFFVLKCNRRLHSKTIIQILIHAYLTWFISLAL